MPVAAINLLNIGLMLISLGVAMFLPFETFLIAYAVLGPLHYLTQISWLHDRQYFTQRKRDWWPLLGLCVVISIGYLVGGSGPEWHFLLPWSVTLLFFAFGAGLVYATMTDPALRNTAMVIIGVAVFLMHGSSLTRIGIGLYVPTVIHVFVFTAAFVLYGALKQRSATAHASLIVFVACAATALFVDPGTLGYVASDYAKDAYEFLLQVHANLAIHTGLADQIAVPATAASTVAPFAAVEEVYRDPIGLQIGRFIAFAYTYHYFNWFSKTSIIRWHEIPRLRAVVIAIAWVASIALYAWDFASGLKWLLFLSLMHVLLEFPLDHKTFLGIGRELYGRIRPAKS